MFWVELTEGKSGRRLPNTPVPVPWELDLATREWRRIDPPSRAPQPIERGLGDLVWEPSLGEVVLLGGTDAVLTAYQEAWTWNGSRWASLNAGGRGGYRAAGMVAESTGSGNSRGPRITTSPLTEGQKYFVLEHITRFRPVEPY